MSLIHESALPSKPQQIGRIVIGRKPKDGPPEALDHFQVCTMERDPETGYFVVDEQIHAHPDVGEKPKRLAGVLMYETPEENFHSEYGVWTRSQQLWRCDGLEGFSLRPDDDGVPKPCPRATGQHCEKCNSWGILRFQLWASPYTLGFHSISLKSPVSVGNVQKTLSYMHRRIGTNFQAPVELILYPRETRYKDESGTARHGSAWTVGLVLAMSMEKAMTHILDQARTLESNRRELRLITGGTFDPEVLEAEKENIPDLVGDEDLEGKSEVAQSGEPLVTPPPPSGPSVAQQGDDPPPPAPDTSRSPATAQLLERLDSIASSAFKVEKFSRERWEALKARVEEGVTQAQVLIWITKLQELVASVAKDHPDSPPPPTNPPEDGFQPSPQRELSEGAEPETEQVAADGLPLDYDLPF